MRHRLILGLLPIVLIACGGDTGDGEGGNNSPATVGGSAGEGGSPTGTLQPGTVRLADGGSAGAAEPTGGASWETGGSNWGPTTDGAPPTGGASTGGVGGVSGWGGAGGYAVDGGAGGSTPTGGYPATGGAYPETGGAAGCCLAMPVCAPGETELDGPGACPLGGDCYSSTICCSTIWCWRSGSVDGGAACNPSAEYAREYVAVSAQQCALITFVCPANTTYFSNDCGCGCEQAPACPEWISCMPPAPPACSPDELAKCPYSQIAY